MTEKTKLIAIIIIILILIVIFLVFNWLGKEGPFINKPEQQERVEVTGKRTKNYRDAEGGPGGTLYFITFKFPDGSVKEFEVGGTGSGKKNYDSLDESDTGILSYIEREDVESKYKDENQYYKGRRFISFEKDPEYGGAKIELPGMSHTAWLIIMIGFFISLAAFCIVFVIYKLQKRL